MENSEDTKKRGNGLVSQIEEKIFFVIGSLLVIIFFLYLVTPLVFAEKFQVIQRLADSDNMEAYLEPESIEVNLSGIRNDEDKAKEVSEIVLKNNTGNYEEGREDIVFMIRKIRREKGVLYLDYNWQFEGEFRRKNMIDRFFRAEVDIDNKTVIFEKDLQPLYFDGTG
ncbi:MAG: hypothetical protein WCV56_02135 [Candidatus Omnitrophota bacterium]